MIYWSTQQYMLDIMVHIYSSLFCMIQLFDSLFIEFKDCFMHVTATAVM